MCRANGLPRFHRIPKPNDFQHVVGIESDNAKLFEVFARITPKSERS